MPSDLINGIVKHIPEVIFIVYVIFQQIQRMGDKKVLLENRSDDYLSLKAKLDCERIQQTKITMNDEIGRYALTKMKFLKKTFESKSTHSNDLEKEAVSGILLSSFVKAERLFIERLKGNGYHDVSSSELEQYIDFVSEEFFESLQDHCENDVGLDIYIDLQEVTKTIRSIINTSISISSRINK